MGDVVANKNLFTILAGVKFLLGDVVTVKLSYNSIY